METMMLLVEECKKQKQPNLIVDHLWPSISQVNTPPGILLLTYIVNASVDAKSGSKIASQVFNFVKNNKNILMNQSEKTVHDLWYELIKAFASDKNLQGSMNVLQFMDENYITPNKYFYVLLLQVCAKSGSLIDGKKVHEHLKKTRIRKDMFVNTSLINMYAKCGNLNEAKEIFSNLRKDNIPINIVT